jgi:protein-S-isoprenylcysteine O-methyltransferase Ste14
MNDRRKWLIATPFVILLGWGLPAIAAGEALWFLGSWTDAVFVLMTTGMWVAGTAFNKLEGRLRFPGHTRLLITLAVIIPVLVAAYDRTHGPGRWLPECVSVAGIMVSLGAVPLGIAARVSLGTYYKPDPQVAVGQRLVTRGVYGLLRHPMYTAALLWAAGLPLVARSWWGLMCSLPLIGLALVLRIREEEELLAGSFGQEYLIYQRRTWRLIPFVY